MVKFDEIVFKFTQCKKCEFYDLELELCVEHIGYTIHPICPEFKDRETEGSR